MKHLLLLISVLLLFSNASFAGEIAFKEPGTAFFSNQVIDRTLVVDKETGARQDLNIEWHLKVKNATPSKGSLPLNGAETVIKINIPEVRVKIPAEIIIKLVSKEKKALSFIQKINLYPPKPELELAGIFGKTSIGLYDPNGKLQAILNKAKCKFEELPNELSMKTFQGDIVLIGPDSFDKDTPDLEKAFKQKIEEGMKFVIFQQKKLVPDASRQFNDAPDNPTEKIEILDFKHKVFGEMKSEDFSSWAPDGISARFGLNILQGRNWRALAKHPKAAEKNKAVSYLIAEINVKKSKFFYCQLPVAEKYETEPRASEFFNNIMRYIVGFQETKKKNVSAYGREEVIDQLKNKIHVAENNPATITHENIVLLLADTDYLEQQFNNRSAVLRVIREHIRTGGTLIVMHLKKEGVAYIKELFRENSVMPDIEEISKDKIKPELKQRGSVLRGISQYDIDNINAIKKSAVEGGEQTLFCIKNKKHYAEMISPGLIVITRIEKGTVFFYQIPSCAGDDEFGLFVERMFFENLEVNMAYN